LPLEQKACLRSKQGYASYSISNKRQSTLASRNSNLEQTADSEHKQKTQQPRVTAFANPQKISAPVDALARSHGHAPL